MLKALCPFICELDDEREEFNLGHWRCFFKCVRLDGNGMVLNVVPLPEKFKLRPGSRVRIHTTGGLFDGMVKEFAKYGITKLYMKEKFVDGPSVIKGIDVERYNEVTIRLLESMKYITMYLSGRRVKPNAFEELFLTGSHENLVRHPFLMNAGDIFVQRSGKNLNDAQAEGVALADNAVSYTVGPPGTGKTTMITAVVLKALHNNKGVLVMCETNNAVKQVADSLLKNYACSARDMTLLVSREYYNAHVDEYDVAHACTRIGERYSRVLLCTLSKAKHLQSDALVKFRGCNSFQYRDTAIIDEAGRVSCCCFSQVLPVLDNFKRLFVVGDPKQGAPYSSKNRTLSSVITVLEKRAEERGIVKRGFLNIQYRMEMDIGVLVSTTFYDGKVESYLKRSGKNLFFHDVRGEIHDRNGSISCNEEAELAMKYARRILHFYIEIARLQFCAIIGFR